ncbi:MAG: HNH endonuclease [Bacteroidales bacterium]|nr:HNH endonuclease [Bacteroidales bacterium]
MIYLRKDIIEKREQIISWINSNKSKKYICQQLKCKQETLNKYLKNWGVEYVGMKGYGKREKVKATYIPLEQYLKHSKDIQSNKVRNKLLIEGIKEHECEMCKRTTWNGQPIPLELHHIDGDRFNNVIENFQLLCPNCHALTDSYRGRNCRKS